MGAQTDARIRLSVDTSQAQQDIRLIDQQLGELGQDTQGIQLGEASSLKRLIDSQKVLSDSQNRLADAMNRWVIQSKRMEAQMKRQQTQTGGGGSTPPPTQSASQAAGGTGSNSNALGGTSANPHSPNSMFGRLKQLGTQLGRLTTVLAVGRAVYGYISTGAQQESNLKSVAYNTYNRTGYYGSDFSAARPNAFALGSAYGYGSQATMEFQQQLMGRGGYTTMDNLKGDTQALMAVTKAYGMDLTSVGQVAGTYMQTGTIKSGDQQKFANMLATSINEAGMTGREAEQLDVLEQINGTLERNAVTVSQDAVTNTLGLYSTLANGNDALKGTRGADVVTTINDAITGGSSQMDLLLGWGTKYKGIEGRWAFEEAKAKGVSDPENLKQIVEFWEQWSHKSIDSSAGKLMLMNQFGLNPDEVNEIVSHADEIRSGTYGQAMASAIEEGVGIDDVNKKLEDYNNSEVRTEELYELSKENAQESVGDAANTIFKPFRDWFGGLSTGWQATLGLGGAAAGGYGTAKAAQWGLGKIGDLLRGAGSGADDAAKAAGGAADDAARAAAGAMDDAARAAAGSADDALRGAAGAADDAARAAAGSLDDAARAASGLDDAARAAAGSMDDAARAAAGSMDDVARAASGTLDDVARAAAGTGDDVLRAAGSAAGSLGKVAKGAAVVGTVAEVVSTGIDVADDIKRGDNRGVASDVGGGVGSLAGGWAGAAAGAEIGAAIGVWAGGVGAFIGAPIGALIGGIGGALAGDAAGTAIGQAGYDTVTGGDKYNFTQDQLNQIGAYYKRCQELYNSDGNNAAQKYTLNTVVPYLKTLGVSKTVTDAYKKDVGYPDFMQDVENGVFGWVPYSKTDKNGNTSGRTESGSSYRSGKFATGNDYVPYDNFPALLHKGEAVLTAAEATDWRQGGSGHLAGSDGRSAADVVDEYAHLVDEESDLLDRREKLYDKYSNPDDLSQTNNTSTQDNSTVTSNNLKESKEDTWLEKFAMLFGLKLGMSSGLFRTIFSKATGVDNVPYDGYMIEAHKGEALLTAAEAKQWRENGLTAYNELTPGLPETSSTTTTTQQPFKGELKIVIDGRVDGMTQENQQQIVSVILSQLQRNTGTGVLSSLSMALERSPH